MFTAFGEQNEIGRLEAALPHGEEVEDGVVHFYFHHAEIKERGTGYIKVLAGRNYGGYAGIDNMVFDFPRLAFLGDYAAEQESLYGRQDFAACHGDIVAHDE